VYLGGIVSQGPALGLFLYRFEYSLVRVCMYVCVYMFVCIGIYLFNFFV